jgi:hypothetical protein
MAQPKKNLKIKTKKNLKPKKRLGNSKKRFLKTLGKTLKRISPSYKKVKKPRKPKTGKKKGGGVGMPIEYYGGTSNVWTSKTASGGKTLPVGFTGVDFSNIGPVV